MAKFLRFIAFACIIIGLSPSASPAWGRGGHQIVAAIAETRLTTDTLAQVQSILGDDKPLSDVANWADAVRRDRPKTASWHYVVLPTSLDDYESSPCLDGQCLTGILPALVTELKENKSTALDRHEQLKFLIHFVGDQAQPLHNTNENLDQGGNKKKVSFYGVNSNLHSVWDGAILNRDMDLMQLSTADYAKNLNAVITADEARLWHKGDFIAWTNEGHVIGIEYSYSNWSAEIGDDYFFQCFPIIRTQLEKGGVRLAHVLNGIFDKNYDGKSAINRPLRLPADKPRLYQPAAKTSATATK
ncbi:S1/P1 nuclease [soil metagenome]